MVLFKGLLRTVAFPVTVEESNRSKECKRNFSKTFLRLLSASLSAKASKERERSKAAGLRDGQRNLPAHRIKRACRTGCPKARFERGPGRLLFSWFYDGDIPHSGVLPQKPARFFAAQRVAFDSNAGTHAHSAGRSKADCLRFDGKARLKFPREDTE